MITRVVSFTVLKDLLDRMPPDEADKYIKRKALKFFFDELEKHIEPKIMQEMNDFGAISTVYVQFELVGGSLPDHEGNS